MAPRPRRLWRPRPIEPIDLGAFNRGEYVDALLPSLNVQTISSFLYPDDSFDEPNRVRIGVRQGQDGAALEGDDLAGAFGTCAEGDVPTGQEVSVDGVGDGQVDRDLSVDFLGVEIGRTGAILDLAGAADGAGRMEEGADERGLADGVVADHGDVTNLGSR